MRKNKEKRIAKDRTFTSTLELFRPLISTVPLSQFVYNQIKNGLFLKKIKNKKWISKLQNSKIKIRKGPNQAKFDLRMFYEKLSI